MDVSSYSCPCSRRTGWLPLDIRVAGLLLLTQVGCLTSHLTGSHSARQAQDRAEVAPHCQKAADDLLANYCSPPMANPPVGMAAALTQQRNGLVMRCKESGLAKSLVRVDACIKELESHE